MVDEELRELLGSHPERAPEAREPKRDGGAYDGKGGVRYFDPEPEITDRGSRDRRCEPSRDADERPEGELSHDLLLVLSDVFLDWDLQ